MMKRTPTLLALLTVILLLVAASRILRLDVWDIQASPDEVWSVWQSFGSLGDVIQRTPYDWPPGYYVVLWGWHHLVGIHPIVLRMASVFAMLVGTAALFRAAERLLGTRGGLLAALAYAGFGYVIFLSIELRGYALLLGLMPLALWQTGRYFDRPSVRRAVVLALLLAAMLYVSLTSAAAWLMLMLFSLMLWPRAVWRWWLPTALTLVLFLPEIVNKASLALRRVDALRDVEVAAGAALAQMYQTFFGSGVWVWVALAVVAGAYLLARWRRGGRVGIALTVWALIPVVLYLTHALIGFFQARYGWWVLPGLALWFGLGLSLLPRRLHGLVGVALAALVLLPPPLSDYQIRPTSIARTFAELARAAHWGDVVFVDPDCDCLEPMETDYYRQVYFPSGLAFVPEPGAHRRVWYVSNWQADSPMLDELRQTRVSAQRFGPPHLDFRLYEAPPDDEGLTFDNGMVFRGLEFPYHDGPFALREGEALPVRLWWSAARDIAQDYSVGLYLLSGDGALVAQADGPPDVGVAGGTSQWATGRPYVEDRLLQLPFPLDAGHYRLRLAVYDWATGTRVDAPGLDADLLYNLGRISVMAW